MTRFAKYGRTEIVFSILIFGIIALFVGWKAHPLWSVSPLSLLFMILWFFRDPQRVNSAGPDILISPADGMVTDVREVEDPGTPGEKALRVGIFLAVWNVHVNRAPCSGMIEWIRYNKGKFLNAMSPKSSSDNESNTICIRPEGMPDRRVTVKQIAGMIARRIVCEPKEGESVRRGDRIGMIKFGSRTELYVPKVEGAEILVRAGQTVKGNLTELARLPGIGENGG